MKWITCALTWGIDTLLQSLKKEIDQLETRNENRFAPLYNLEMVAVLLIQTGTGKKSIEHRLKNVYLMVSAFWKSTTGNLRPIKFKTDIFTV